MKKILVIGGGFAGMMAALNAVDENDHHGGDIAVTLVSPTPYITIRPRLYEKNAESLRAPLLPTFDPVGVAFVDGAARDIDTEARTVTVERTNGGAETLDYDRLILATGSELRDAPIPGVGAHAFNIDTYDAAVKLDEHLRVVAASSDTPGHDTFVVIGGGMSGIEMAAEMRNRIEEHADAATASRARVVLIEQAGVVGPDLGDDPRPIIQEALAAADVDIRLNTTVTGVTEDAVTLSDGERIATATTIVTVGLRASALGERVPVALDEFGRVPVDDMLRVIGVEGVYATGDIARAIADGEQPALMSCQHGRTMGKYAGYNAARDLLGQPPRAYRQTDYSTCLDLGNFGAVLTTGWDRKVGHFGEEAMKRKMWINGELIYPPTGNREEILAGGRIDEKTGR